MPERPIAPGLARHGTEPMIKNCELLRQFTQHGDRVWREALHDYLALIGGRPLPTFQLRKSIEVVSNEALHRHKV
jgi:hypothetical protein